MITAIIVDDEKKSRELLEILLRNNCPNVTVIGQANSVEQALTLINKTPPDVIFLDIEMPGGSGFDLLEKIKHQKFSVIFTTAYHQYAIKAFKFSAIDYLLKPFDEDELIQAVKRAELQLSKHHKIPTVELESAKNNYTNLLSGNSKLALTTQSGLVFVEIKQIVRCEADGKYTMCYLSNNTRICVTKNLKGFELILNDYDFVRLHNSHLVNIHFIKEYHQGRGGYISMHDGSTIAVSQRKKEEFLKRINKI